TLKELVFECCPQSAYHREGSPQKNFKKKYDKQYKMRIMRGSIQEELQPLTSLTMARECVQVFYDVVQCHHWVWKYPQILHRDISPGNIMVHEKNGQKFGFRTGTTPYMAHEQHFTAWEGPHRYRHDMESVFYVILLLTCLCSSPSEKLPTPPETDHSYETWYKESDNLLRGRKNIILNAGNWQPSTTPFFDGFSSWLESLQCKLSLGFSELQKHLRATKTAQKIQQNSLPHPMTEVPSFDEDLLGGYFSYKDIVLIMHVFADDALETCSHFSMYYHYGFAFFHSKLKFFFNFIPLLVVSVRQAQSPLHKPHGPNRRRFMLTAWSSLSASPKKGEKKATACVWLFQGTENLQQAATHPHGQDEDATVDLLNTEQDLLDDRVDERALQTPATPKRRHVVPDSILVTPFGRYSHTYSPSISHDRQYKVEEVNKFLEADLTELRTLPLGEWAQYALNLDLDKDSYTLKETVKTKYNAYLMAVDDANVKTQIYPALVALLNSFSENGKQGDSAVIFYTQDPFPVRGSIAEQKPDIGAVFKKIFGHGLAKLKTEVKRRIHILGAVAQLGKDARVPPLGEGDEQPQTSNKKSNSTSKKRARSQDTSNKATKKKRTPKGSTSEGQPCRSNGGKVTSGLFLLLYFIICHTNIKKLDFAHQAVSLPPMAFSPHTLKAMPDRVSNMGTRVQTIVESGLLNLEDEEHQLIFAKMIKHLHSLPLQGLGIVPNLDAKFLKDPQSLKYGFILPQYFAANGPPSNEIFENPQGSLGTIVIQVECTCAGCGNHCDWAGKKLVLKLSFPVKTWVSEQTFMDRCRELAQGEHAWVLNHLPDIHWLFDILFREGTPQRNFKMKFQEDYEMRIMRGSIQEELKPLTSLTTARECAQVFYDIIQCHHWVWKYARILHRDISPGNIMVRKKNGENVGVLNDWDLAAWVNKLRDGPTSKFRTGTVPYMAHEQHSIEWKGLHFYRHDMESVFYAILLLTCLRSSLSEKLPTPPKTDFSYATWHEEDDDTLQGRKDSLIHRAPWQPSTTAFFNGFSAWLVDLQFNLRDDFVKLGDSRHTKAPQKVTWQRPNPVLLNFDEDTLGGRFSYEEIMWVVHVFENEDLKTRGREWQNALLLRLQKEQQDEQRQKEQYKQQQEEPKKN
ncbi:hypothetical protein F5050DRAFT_1715387, partial [Lentinula boryana]